MVFVSSIKCSLNLKKQRKLLSVHSLLIMAFLFPDILRLLFHLSLPSGRTLLSHSFKKDLYIFILWYGCFACMSVGLL